MSVLVPHAMKNGNVKISRFLSFVLRHNPDAIGLHLDSEGWASLDELIKGAAKKGRPLTRNAIAEVVATNDKRRFSLSPDGSRIRANQGHSIPVDLGLKPLKPPGVLYHGTAARFLKSILQEGLRASGRHHVHFSLDKDAAKEVGRRHGKPVVIRIDALQMHSDGYRFYRSENGVWLTDHVPAQYLKVLEMK